MSPPQRIPHSPIHNTLHRAQGFAIQEQFACLDSTQLPSSFRTRATRYFWGGAETYMVLFDSIIHCARFPKFLKIVANELYQQCLEVLERLLQHGRLSLKQMFDRATSNQNQGNAVVPDAIQEALLKLVSAHYVEC